MGGVRSPRRHLPRSDVGRRSAEPHVGSGRGHEPPPPLLPRRLYDRLHLGPGRSVQPLAHGRRWRASPPGRPRSRAPDVRPLMDARRPQHRRAPVRRVPPAPRGPERPVDVQPGGGAGRRAGGRRERPAHGQPGGVADRVAGRALRVLPCVRGRAGRRHADRRPAGGVAAPPPRPDDRRGRADHRGRAGVLGPELQRERVRPRGVAGRAVARLRAADSGRDDLVQGSSLRAPHRALAAGPAERAREGGDGSHHHRRGGRREDVPDPAGVRMDVGFALDRDHAGRPHPPAGRRVRRGDGRPIHRSRDPDLLPDGAGRGAGRRRSVPGAVPALVHGVSRRADARVPGRREDLADGPCGGYPSPADAGRLRALRVRAVVVARRAGVGVHHLRRRGRGGMEGPGPRRPTRATDGGAGGIRKSRVEPGRTLPRRRAWERCLRSRTGRGRQPLLGPGARAGHGRRDGGRDDRPRRGRP